MYKKEDFLSRLRAGLSGLPREDVEERLSFYSEMIDDRMEEGETEEEAVKAAGPPEAIAELIIADYPLKKLVKQRTKKTHPRTSGEIVLLVLGAPLWIPLLAAAFAVVLSLYLALWSVVLSLWAVFASLALSAVVFVLPGVFLSLSADRLMGLALIGAGLLCAGLSVFLFFGCKAAGKGILKLTKWIVLGVKRCFIRKEASHA